MATYNNKHWLLSHVRNSFISTDDTGLCEAIMILEDMPSQYAAARQASANKRRTMAAAVASPTRGRTDAGTTDDIDAADASSSDDDNHNFICYPGLDQSDDDGAYPEAQSYDIQMEQGGFIHRSNTAQKLDKMKLASRRAAKIKNVKCTDQQSSSNETSAAAESHASFLFERKPVGQPQPPPSTALADLLARHPRLPQNAYAQYARFDGSGQRSNLVKHIRVFITMLPPAARNYPLQMCVLETARVQEFIGLICYRATIEHPALVLQTVRNYALHITEEDGEVDVDFPPLDAAEPVAKFCFGHLSLVERRASEVRQDARTMSLSSEVEAMQETLLEESAAASAQQSEALRRMKGHTMKMEAPMYRSYRLQISRKGFFRTDIQLGISAEKLEIDPVRQQQSSSARFWSHQKAISHSMDAVVWCEITEEPTPAKALVKIVYCPGAGAGGGGGGGGDDDVGVSLRRNELNESGKKGTPTSVSMVGCAGGLNGLSAMPNMASSAYRSYKFVTDAVTAQEIVDKVRNILEVRSSPARREYMQRYATVGLTKKAGTDGADDGAGVSMHLEKRRKPFKKLFK